MRPLVPSRLLRLHRGKNSPRRAPRIPCPMFLTYLQVSKASIGKTIKYDVYKITDIDKNFASVKTLEI